MANGHFSCVSGLMYALTSLQHVVIKTVFSSQFGVMKRKLTILVRFHLNII